LETKAPADEDLNAVRGVILIGTAGLLAVETTRQWACLAYHEWLQAGASDHEVREAAVAAVQTVLPLP